MTKLEQRFFGLLKADNTASGDTERLQLFYVLARTDALWEKATRIYDTEKHCLKKGWDEIFDGTFGKMLQRAAHLYNSQNEDIDTVKLFWGMDSHNSETMINAQMIYCNQFNFEKMQRRD